jgi:hypothetical protein
LLILVKITNYKAPECAFSIHNGRKLFDNMGKMSVNPTGTTLLTFINNLKCSKCLPFYINTLSASLCLPRSLGKREDVAIIVRKTVLFFKHRMSIDLRITLYICITSSLFTSKYFPTHFVFRRSQYKSLPYGKARQLQPTVLPHNSLRIRLEGRICLYIYIYIYIYIYTGC